MSCNIEESKRQVRLQAAALKYLLSNGVETHNGVSLQEAAEELERMQEHLQRGNVEEVQSIASNKVSKGSTKTVLDAVLKTNTIKAVFEKDGKASTVETLVITDAVRSPDGKAIKLTLSPVGRSTSYHYVFSRNSSDSSKSLVSSSGKKLVPIEEDTAKKILRALDISHSYSQKKAYDDKAADIISYVNKELEMDDNLGSKPVPNYIDLSQYTKMDGYVHGSVDYMVQMLDKLYVLGGNRGTPEHLAYLKGLFRSMDSSFFYDMDLYIKENSDDSSGVVRLNNRQIVLDVAKKGTVTDKSDMEVYAEEVVHTMIAWALRSPYASKFKTQGNYIIKQLTDKIKWQDLLEVDVRVATPEQIKKAQDQYAYVFASTNSLDETLTQVLTNPRLVGLAKKIPLTDSNTHRTMLEKLVDYFFRAVNIALGRFDFSDRNKTVYEKVHSLAFSLAEINVETEAKLDRMGAFGVFSDWFHSMDRATSDKIKDLEGRLFENGEQMIPYPENGSPYTKAFWFMKAIGKGITHPTYRGAIGIWASALGMQVNGSVREIIRNFLPELENRHKQAEWDNLQANKIDGIKMSYINQVKKSLVDAFRTRPTQEEEAAMTRTLLDTNATHLLYRNPDNQNKKQYTTAELREVLEDRNKLETRIGRVKHKLQGLDPDRYNWLQNQAVSLGYYMATYKATLATNFSAENIAIGIGYGSKVKLDPVLVDVINELASLVAIKYTDAKYNKAVAELMRREPQGVTAIANTYEAFKAESKEKLFKSDRAHMMTGYSTELFDPTIEVLVKPLSERSELEKVGYKFTGVLTSKYGVGHTEPVGMFVSESHSRAERLRGSVGLSTAHAKGTSIRAINFENDESIANLTFERDMIKLNSKAREIHEAMNSGTFDVEKVIYGIAPVYDARGNVSDYRMMMDKAQKEDLLKQDLSVTEVLSRTVGTVIDKTMRKELNKQVLKTIEEDMKENWEQGKIGKRNFEEYALIGPNATAPEMVQLYYMLPEDYRAFINSRADKTMAVPKILLDTYFGYPHVKISNALKGFPTYVIKFVDFAQSLWEELIKVVKTNILLKMPAILIGNFISNVLYMLNTQNINPVELFKMYRESWADISDYVKMRREFVDLDNEIKRDKAALNRVAGTAGLRHKITQKELRKKSIVKRMENSPIHELFVAGMYQTVVEDVETASVSSTNAWKRKADRFLGKLHPVIKTPLQVAYLSEETKWYQVNQEFLQISDLLARDVLNRRQKIVNSKIADGKLVFPYEWRKEKGDNYPEKKVLVGKEREEWFVYADRLRREEVLDSFINYQRANGKGEEFLNRVGALMFTKYVKRIQRVIARAGTNHPIKTVLTLLLASAFIDVDNIQDQQALIKGFDSEGWSITNVFPVYSPAEHVMNVITPAIIKDDGPLGMVM